LVCTEYIQGHTKNAAVVLLLLRILYWFFHHILTALRKIIMMLPWKTVGLHGPSSSSASTCAKRTEDCLRQAATKQAQTISCSTWFSSAPLRSLHCPSKDPWKMLWWSSFMNHPRHHVYVAPAENMVGRIPLMPCFSDDNATPTIPHKYSKNKISCFLAGCAEAAAEDVKRCSNVYQVNPWLWQFGRAKPRIGGLTIEETAEKQDCQQIIGQA
jgi:hypothetical protein